MQEYVVNIGGLDHTVLLSDEDAKTRGLHIEPKAAPTPANKASKSPANKSKD
jgi:hypothetical protein